MNDSLITNLLGKSVFFSHGSGVISAIWISKTGPIEFLIVASDGKPHQVSLDQIERVLDYK